MMNCKLKFIDLFAGCGGLSLGLMNAGLEGIFAIEKTEDAFKTLIHNLDHKKIKNGYKWPIWLPKKNMTTRDLLDNYQSQLQELKDKVDLIAGGPPCQGFSFAGLRDPNDPRNRLTEEYIEIVSIINPKFLLLENVKGFQAAFKKNGASTQAYSEYVVERLSNLNKGYKVFSKVLPASLFGVPQPRPRFIMIAVRNDIAQKISYTTLGNEEFYQKILQQADKFKKENNLSKITVLGDAIGDLEIKGKKLIECIDSKNFKQINYTEPKILNPYLKLIRRNVKKDFMPDSLRIPNHKKETRNKFEYILLKSIKGHTLSKELRKELHIKKQCFTVLSSKALSTTITTLPDDCMHYSEPRVLTVRENARIQSFPDWFEFKGKYTTGGDRRKIECPRYTQVGNAVPPLMAEILGQSILAIERLINE